jgi:hypothetical protein
MQILPTTSSVLELDQKSSGQPVLARSKVGAPIRNERTGKLGDGKTWGPTGSLLA